MKKLYGKYNMFYVVESENSPSYKVMHVQLTGSDRLTAEFWYDWSLSKTRALKAAKKFCKLMNIYFPAKLKRFKIIDETKSMIRPITISIEDCAAYNGPKSGINTGGFKK